MNFFKFARHQSGRKMRKRVDERNARAMRRLERDPGWQAVMAVSNQNSGVREMLRRARKYCGVKFV